MAKSYRHQMNRHPEALVAKAKKCEVFFTTTRPDIMVVKSPSGAKYYVRLMVAGSSERQVEMMCNCEFCAKYANQDRACAHKIAAEMKLNRDFGQYTSFWAKKDDAKRQHRIIVEVQDLFATIRNS